MRTITEAGIQAVLSIVDDAGLLAPPPEYPDRNNVADATTAVLTLAFGKLAEDYQRGLQVLGETVSKRPRARTGRRWMDVLVNLKR